MSSSFIQSSLDSSPGENSNCEFNASLARVSQLEFANNFFTASTSSALPQYAFFGILIF
jgi:hypothetical protein